MKNEQEQFWMGDFGDAYTARNVGDKLIASKTAIFSEILAGTRDVRSVLELGANIGLNIRALKRLLPEASFKAVEINESAYQKLREIQGLEAHHGTILDFCTEPVDFAFTMGVLIHINPDALEQAYATLNASSRRYIAIVEYYNPTPMEVTYRGHTGKLFKRDWCAEFMSRHPSRLVDYGFQYHGDPVFPADDFTWFLLEKTS